MLYNENQLKKESIRHLIIDTIGLFLIFLVIMVLLYVIGIQLIEVNPEYQLHALIYLVIFVLVSRLVQKKNYRYESITLTDSLKRQILLDHLNQKKASLIQTENNVRYYTIKSKYFLIQSKVIVKESETQIDFIAPHGVIIEVQSKMEL